MIDDDVLTPRGCWMTVLLERLACNQSRNDDR
jgi:hypothetical protein